MRNNALIDDKIFMYFLMKEGIFFSNMTLHSLLTHEENFLNLHPITNIHSVGRKFSKFFISVKIFHIREEEKWCFKT
jgi:hypothetical protein